MTTSITFDRFVQAFQATSVWAAEHRTPFVTGTNICFTAADAQNYLIDALKQHETDGHRKTLTIRRIKTVQILTRKLNAALSDLAQSCTNVVTSHGQNIEFGPVSSGIFTRQLTIPSTNKTITVDSCNDVPNLFEELSRHLMLECRDGSVYVSNRMLPDGTISHLFSKGDLQFCDEVGILVEPNVVMDPSLG
jgi:hypothetical protein